MSLGSRIDDGRPLYQPPPKPAKAKGGMRRESKKRAKLNRDYEPRAAEYRELNPVCAYCGAPTECVDHICSGGNKEATLTDFDTINPSCWSCNREHFPIDVKLAAKVRHVVRRIEQRRGRRLTAEQLNKVIEGLRE